MTIYGSGGTGVRDSRRLHPGVLGLLITAVVIIVAVLAWLVMRSPAETPQPVAASAAPAVSTPAAAPSPTAPSGLAVGSWLVPPADDQDEYLTVRGEFATI